MQSGPGDNSAQASQRLTGVILGGALVALTLLLYNPVVHFPFISFDDPLYVSQNAHVITGLSSANVHWAFHTFEMGHWHPLTWLSHMLDSQLFGLHPAGHHYSNVLLHAANVLLLYVLLASATRYRLRSFLVAALFAIHPLNVESVAWIADRKTLLSAFFSFLMFSAYAWYARKPRLDRYALVLVTFILALMAKSMAVTMPLALLIADYWPLSRFDHAPSGESRRATAIRLFVEKLPLLLISAVFSYLAVLAQKASGALNNTAQPVSDHLKNAAVGYMLYLAKCFWPSHLAVYYPLPQHLAAAKVVLAFILLIAISVAAFAFRQQRFFPAGWAFFLLCLLPVIGLVQVGGQLMADRYAYTPLIGIYVVVIWGAAELFRRYSLSETFAVCLSLCLITALAITTHATLSHWHSSIALFTQAEKVAGHPDPSIETDLGLAYNEAGMPHEALKHLLLARSQSPHGSLALGTFLVQHGQLRESIPELEDAVKYAPTNAIRESALNNLAAAYLLLGNYPQSERAFTSALQLNPLRRNSLFGRGQAFYADGKFDDAIQDFAHALQLAPGPELYLWLGKALEAEHRNEQALAAYNMAANAATTAAEAQQRIAALRKGMAAPPR